MIMALRVLRVCGRSASATHAMMWFCLPTGSSEKICCRSTSQKAARRSAGKGSVGLPRALRRDNQEVRGAAPVDQQKYRLLVRSREGLPILDISHRFAVHFLNDVAPLETGFGCGARWIDARHQHTSNRRR